jgi:hypothetical protein
MTRRLRRLWRRWVATSTPGPAEPAKASTLPSHDAWLAELLDELRTPESQRAFEHADVLRVLTQPTPAMLNWLRGIERTDP